jgi:hypothetical protein
MLREQVVQREDAGEALAERLQFGLLPSAIVGRGSTTTTLKPRS